MATLDITKIPAPRVPLIDENTGLMAREWYRFFYNLFVLAGSGGNQITLDDLQVGPPNQPDLAELLIQVNQNIAPPYEDQSGDFLATLDTAQLMSMMARFENVEAAIQGAYLNPPSIPTDGVYVPYTNATANVDLNAKTLTNVSHVGINTTTVPTTLLRAFGDNNTSSRISVRGYSSDANSSSMRVTKFRGAYATPQAPQSGDSLGKFELAGYGTTSSDGYAQASFEGVATENWGATARGSKTLIKVTPNTTTTQVTAVTIDQDKSVTFATTASATTFIGALTGIASGNVLSVSGTAPVVSSGGTTPAISMPKATTSVDGYLSSTDWTTFNSKGSGSVTSVAQSFTGGLISVAGSPITTSGTLALTVAGTSGGIPYFSSASTWATSAALTASALVVGGGAGAAPATTTTGTGVVTALGVNTGTAGAFVINGGALGTPSSGTVTNLTGTASININGTVGATTPTTGKFTTIEGTDTTDASSTTTGALKTAGGLGVAKKLYVGSEIYPSQTAGIVGTTTNNNANAGSFGEVITASVSAASPTTMTASGASVILTSVSLTAGDWEVTGVVGFTNVSGSTIIGYWIVGSTTAAVLGAGANTNSQVINSAGVSTTIDITQPIPTIRYLLSTTTTINLIARASNSAGTLGGYGFISARRMR